ncbi:MAG: MBL fold metallo-hydrolase [Paracoccaceae bacterium]|nr:MBL fold metallo-hydrolase [Paracoccaceae bacterium]
MRLALIAAIALLAAPVSAQERRPSHCIAIAEAAPGVAYLQKASWTEPLEDFTVRLSYVNHSMFLLQTPGGLSAVTDYTGFVGSVDLVPDVVTMNNAHSSHWTPNPDPRIPNVLEGWQDENGPADHYLDLGEMLVRNVTTDIRSGFGGRVDDGNSIFVFEVGGLCIGHLGHLHHEPTEQQYAALGRLDVVMAAVDGGLTVDLPTMTRIVKRLKSSVVIPMHWFSTVSLDAFLAGVSDEFDIRRDGVSSLDISLRTLPDRPTVMVLEPVWLAASD